MSPEELLRCLMHQRPSYPQECLAGRMLGGSLWATRRGGRSGHERYVRDARRRRARRVPFVGLTLLLSLQVPVLSLRMLPTPVDGRGCFDVARLEDFSVLQISRCC
jgi:hypothetical protein